MLILHLCIFRRHIYQPLIYILEDNVIRRGRASATGIRTHYHSVKGVTINDSAAKKNKHLVNFLKCCASESTFKFIISLFLAILNLELPETIIHNNIQ